MGKDEEKLIIFLGKKIDNRRGEKKEKKGEEITIFHLSSLPLSFTS